MPKYSRLEAHRRGLLEQIIIQRRPFIQARLQTLLQGSKEFILVTHDLARLIDELVGNRGDLLQYYQAPNEMEAKIKMGSEALESVLANIREWGYEVRVDKTKYDIWVEGVK